MPPKVAIVIVSHNRQQLLTRCLESCAKQTYPDVQILVILNPDLPGQCHEAAIRFPGVKVIRTHRNIGFFPALNLAIANSDGDYVMTVDDDAYFLDDDLLQKFVKSFQNEPELAAVTCNIEGPSENPAIPDDHYITSFKPGFTMLPRRLFTDPEWIGYYPDIFFRSAGETYVCTRAWDTGGRVKQLKVTGMYHDLTGQGRSNRDWSFYGLRSQILCAVMREPWWYLQLHLPVIFVRSLLFQLRTRCPIRWWAQAWLSALFHLPTAFAFRAPIRWGTLKLMRRLQHEVITDPTLLG
jgi:GT2 family glycosyltransferase